MQAVDISNYTGAIDAAWIAARKAEGVGLFIVETVDPPAPYPKTQTVNQLLTLRAEKVITDIYDYLWWSDDYDSISKRLDLADGFKLRRLWVDLECTTKDMPRNPTLRADHIKYALVRYTDWAAARSMSVGIYTGKWFVDGYLSGIDQSFINGYPLWAPKSSVPNVWGAPLALMQDPSTGNFSYETLSSSEEAAIKALLPVDKTAVVAEIQTHLAAISRLSQKLLEA